MEYLRTEKLWGNDYPLFPASLIVPGSTWKFEVAGLSRKHWSTASPIRTIFLDAFTRADLPYFNPHSFRNTLAQLGEKMCGNPEHFKAWSQNLGHEKVLTTLYSYGEISCQRQGEIIRDLAAPEQDMPSDVNKIAEAVFRKLRESGVDMGTEKRS